MIPKCEQYWPDRAEKIKKLGHMEVIWKNEATTRPAFKQQKFIVRKNSEGISNYRVLKFIWISINLAQRIL